MTEYFSPKQICSKDDIDMVNDYVARSHPDSSRSRIRSTTNATMAEHFDQLILAIESPVCVPILGILSEENIGRSKKKGYM